MSRGFPQRGGASRDDPGDDVQRRFRYQNTLAALEALGVIDDTLEEPISAVICEQFEDILIELTSGLLIAIAVKTRSGLELHRATDREIALACRRFCLLHRLLGAAIAKFVIHSSAGFHYADTGTSLPYVIELATRAATAEEFAALPKARAFITAVCQGAATLQDLFAVLRKLAPRNGPRLDAIQSTFEARIMHVRQFGNWPAASVSAFARELVHAAWLAASLRAQDDDATFTSELAIDRTEYEQSLAGKRLDRATILAIVQAVETGAPTNEEAASALLLPAGSSMLERKMALGLFDIDNIALAQRQKEHVESVFVSWRNRYRASGAVERIKKVQVVVQSAFVEAKDEVQADGHLSGPSIMEQVRRKLREISTTRKEDVFGLGYEQLLGVAALLTDQCDIWWSKTRSLPAVE